MKPSEIHTLDELAEAIAPHLARGQYAYFSVALNVVRHDRVSVSKKFAINASDEENDQLELRLRPVFANSLAQCYEKFLSEILPHLRRE